MILLDTNVISEILRPDPALPVKRWMERQPAQSIFTAVICEAEIQLGLALLPLGRRRRALEEAVMAIFQEVLTDRILPFDRSAAGAYAVIGAVRRKMRRPISTLDAQIAAIARAHGATVATRNVADFTGCGVDIVDPWHV
ncbi:MAG: type II toxin-antitoxin system VapC family toxin [Alphaproteobacteria bacterium]|nr:type II toxin-antitoxin system VapC family toxin [Alphaproteobacteria bacterium]